MQIMLVDNSRTFLDYAGNLLKNTIASQTFTSDSGRNALQIAKDIDLDLVLINESLPGIDLFHFVQQIKARDNHIKVFILFDGKKSQNMDLALTAGADDFLFKPLDEAELLIRIRAAAENQKLNDSDKYLNHLNRCFLSFGASPRENIKKLVTTAGEILQATCVLYNTLQGDTLVNEAGWQLPADFPPHDTAEGHLCHDLIVNFSGEVPFIVNNLLESSYVETDENVLRYGLQTYVGYPVKVEEKRIGAFCAVFREQRYFKEDELLVMQTLAQALQIEEERKRAEAELMEERNFSSKVIETVGNCIVVLDAEGRIVHFNRASQQITGYSSMEVSGRYYWDIFLEREEVELTKAFHSELRQEDLPFNIESQWVMKDGNIRLFLWSNTSIQDRDGSIKYLIYTGIDITERKKVEESLRDTNEKLATLINTSPVAVFSLNPEGVVSSWSLAAERIFGWDKKDVLGCRAPMVPTEKWEYFLTISDRALQGMSFTGEEFYFQRKDGFPVTASLSLAPLRNPSGSITDIFFLAEDITERQKAKKKLSLYTAEIELKNEELEKVYNQLNLEFEKARYIHEREMCKKIHPMGPYSFAGHYQPAAVLGGDFYSVMELGDQVIIYMVDVTGHGLDSTMLSIFAKNTINSYIHLQNDRGESLSPQQILNHLSLQYCRENFPDGYFICVFLGILDLKKDQFVYSNAGIHTAPLLVSGDGIMTQLCCAGLPVSHNVPFELLIYEEESLKLLPGTTMIFTTDGLLEQRTGNGLYEKRFLDVFSRNYYLPPELLVKVVTEDFTQITGTLQGDDDITFLVMQYAAEETKSMFMDLESSIEVLDEIEKELTNFLSPYTDDVHTILMGVNEMVLNAVEYGNNFDYNKKVFITVTATEKFIQITVKDEGKGFNWKEGLNQKIDLFSGAERGRGIIITKMCFDYIYYHQSGNEVSLLKKIMGNR
jgi:PAS domain S-box-containing protein